MNEREEQAYVRGKRTAYEQIARQCLAHLEASNAQKYDELLLERARIVTALRRVCATHGDNEWADGLDLVDVIEKHLERHLDS